MSEQPPDRGADTAAGLPLGYYQDQSERALRRWYDAQSGQQAQPPPVRQEPQLPYRQQQSYGQPRQPSFTPDPQYGTSPGQPPYRDHRQPEPPSGHRGRPARKSWPQRHKVLTVLGSLTALIIVIGGIASASGRAKQADNASAVATTTPTRTATPSRTPTHHATSTKTVPAKAPVTAQAATPAPAATTRAPATTAPAAAPPPPAATTPAGCQPLSDEGTCYEPGEYCRDANHGTSGVAGDGEAITCEDNDGWRWEPS